MRKTWSIAKKELKQIGRDPLSLLTLLGFPAFMLVLYGFALNFDVRHVTLAVQDRDKSAASRDLVAAFVNSSYFDIVATPAPGEDVEALTRRCVARAALVIPEGFGARLAGGKSASAQMLLDGADSLTATTVLGYANAIVAETNARILGRVLRRAGRRLESAVTFEPRVFYNPELRSAQFLVPGLIGMIMMITAVLSTALSVVRERERGTMEQVRMAPIRPFQLILGKTVPYLVISLFATIFILAAARVLFGVVIRGPLLDLFLATLLYLAGSLGLGLVFSTLVATQALAFQVSLLASLLPSMLLSGFVFQIRIMPVWLQAITYLVPTRYYLVILRGIILKGAGLGPYWPEMGCLALFAVVMIGLASWRMARQGA
ncbi:MAG: ABC transporter permease [Vicinamibacteria bacterium]|nr:ABC transporter permease [Vicinamibacteria bacterium]